MINTDAPQPAPTTAGRASNAVIWVVLIALVVPFVAQVVSLIPTDNAVVESIRIRALLDERDEWRGRNAQLEHELAKARSLPWVETEAITRLQMQRPTTEIVAAVDMPPPSIASAGRRQWPVDEAPPLASRSTRPIWLTVFGPPADDEGGSRPAP